MTSRSGKSTEVVFKELAGLIEESLLEEVNQLCAAEQFSATAYHDMEVFGEVHLGFNLLIACDGHGIVRITE